jgi:hypothetical protein
VLAPAADEVEGEGEEEAEEVDEEEPADAGSPHASCVHGRDIITILRMQQEYWMSRNRIEMILTLEAQMQFAEDRLAQMRSNLRKEYLMNLEDYTKNVGAQFSSRELKYYALVLKLVIEEAVERLRHAFRDNHFVEKTDVDFESYRRDKSELIASAMMEAYHEYLGIGNLEAKEIRQELVYNKIRDVVSECFVQARKVAQEKHAEVMTLQQSFNDNIVRLFGQETWL